VAQKLVTSSEARLLQHLEVTLEGKLSRAHQPPEGGQRGTQTGAHYCVPWGSACRMIELFEQAAREIRNYMNASTPHQNGGQTPRKVDGEDTPKAQPLEQHAAIENVGYDQNGSIHSSDGAGP
jgi:hypothetical protein